MDHLIVVLVTHPQRAVEQANETYASPSVLPKQAAAASHGRWWEMQILLRQNQNLWGWSSRTCLNKILRWSVCTRGGGGILYYDRASQRAHMSLWGFWSHCTFWFSGLWAGPESLAFLTSSQEMLLLLVCRPHRDQQSSNDRTKREENSLILALRTTN